MKLSMFLWLGPILQGALGNPASSDSDRRSWVIRLRSKRSGWITDREEYVSDRDEAKAMVEKMGFRLADKVEIGDLEGYFLVEEPQISERRDGTGTTLLHRRSPEEDESILRRSFNVEWFEQQVFRRREKRGIQWNDPMYPDQVYLGGSHNLDTIHQDLFVHPLWEQGINGTGIRVAMIDDGLEIWHPDLSSAYRAETSWDIVNNRPLGRISDIADNHGTRCAGQIVSKPNNSYCGVGVAFGATLSGLKLLGSSQTSDVQEATAMAYKYNENHIYSSSWGPSDDGKTVEGPGSLAAQALLRGIEQGRNGLGSVYVFASGNGGLQDNCNFDGYANSIHTITIGALDSDGKLPPFGEHCAAQLASTFSGGYNGGRQKIYTADIDMKCSRPPCCTEEHTGTSAAAPFASALIALALSYRPNLSWRDLQHIIVNSAQKTDASDQDWTVNAAGFSVNHKYGFGALHGERMMAVARTFVRVPKSATRALESGAINLRIPATSTIESSIEVDVVQTDTAQDVHSIEHVQVQVTIAHPSRQNLLIDLVAPGNTTSTLTTLRKNDISDAGFAGWTFMSVRHWGESPKGKWTLRIRDVRSHGDPGLLVRWMLVVSGIPCPKSQWVSLADGLDGNSCVSTIRDTNNTAVRTWAVAMACIVLLLFGILAYCRYGYTFRLLGIRHHRRNRALDSSAELEEIITPSSHNMPPLHNYPLTAPVIALSPRKEAELGLTGGRTTPTIARSASTRRMSPDQALRVGTTAMGTGDMGQLRSPMPLELQLVRSGAQLVREQETNREEATDGIFSPQSPNTKAKFQLLKGKRLMNKKK